MSACSGLAQFQSIDCFDALDELHKGRHSTVWSAKYRPTGELVVLKGYSRSALKPRQLAHVYSEINILNALNAARHPGVVTLLASFDTSEFVYLVFEACMRGDLYQLLLKEKGRLDEQYLGRVIMRPLLTTLAQLHSRGIIHRDVKPENIFLTLGGEVQLGDFGLAATKGCDKLTERVGTLDYLSPEVLAMPTPNEAAVGRGGVLQPYDEKVDVWALGCLCFEMLAGKPPFEVEDPKETAKLILAAKPAPMPSHISPGCADFIRQALTRRPSQRPSAQDLLQHRWLRPFLPPSFPCQPPALLPAAAMHKSSAHSPPPAPAPVLGPTTPDQGQPPLSQPSPSHRPLPPLAPSLSHPTAAAAASSPPLASPPVRLQQVRTHSPQACKRSSMSRARGAAQLSSSEPRQPCQQQQQEGEGEGEGEEGEEEGAPLTPPGHPGPPCKVCWSGDLSGVDLSDTLLPPAPHPGQPPMARGGARSASGGGGTCLKRGTCLFDPAPAGPERMDFPSPGPSCPAPPSALATPQAGPAPWQQPAPQAPSRSPLPLTPVLEPRQSSGSSSSQGGEVGRGWGGMPSPGPDQGQLLPGGGLEPAASPLPPRLLGRGAAVQGLRLDFEAGVGAGAGAGQQDCLLVQGVPGPLLAAALARENAKQRRASSGTSDYLAYSTPALHPSSPESLSRTTSSHLGDAAAATHPHPHPHPAPTCGHPLPGPVPEEPRPTAAAAAAAASDGLGGSPPPLTQHPHLLPAPSGHLPLPLPPAAYNLGYQPGGRAEGGAAPQPAVPAGTVGPLPGSAGGAAGEAGTGFAWQAGSAAGGALKRHAVGKSRFAR